MTDPAIIAMEAYMGHELESNGYLEGMEAVGEEKDEQRTEGEDAVQSVLP